MAVIVLSDVSKVYPNGVEAVRSLNLEVGEGEFMVLVGPSGCGKTTALRMVAGLEAITSGVLRIGDRVVNDVAPKDRDIAMVFQNYALYPHMTVEQNMAFPLKLSKVPKSAIKDRVGAAAQTLGLADRLDRKPAQLSGGQRQRVAMGRAIVREPRVFLMDEPLSNLDAKLRVQMRAEVLRIQRRLGVATLYVTHDQTEAMTMGDRVAVMRDGLLQQCDKPQVLYERPRNLFVAAFIGSPAMNVYEAEVDDLAETVLLGTQRLDLPASLREARPGLADYASRPVVLGVRPEDVALADGDAPQALDADIELVEALGSELLVHFNLDAKRVHAEGADILLEEGLEEVEGTVGSGEGVARVNPGSRIQAGDRARFVLDLEKLHFFSPDTGEAIF